jgi:hypothetical protein
MHHKKFDNFSYCCKFSVFLEQQNFEGDLTPHFWCFLALKKGFVSLLFLSVFINFKTIYIFLERRFDEEKNFALLEHLKMLRKN